jgi:hypothetical protein
MVKINNNFKFTKSLASTKPFGAFAELTPEKQQRFKPKRVFPMYVLYPLYVFQ